MLKPHASTCVHVFRLTPVFSFSHSQSRFGLLNAFEPIGKALPKILRNEDTAASALTAQAVCVGVLGTDRAANRLRIEPMRKREEIGRNFCEKPKFQRRSHEKESAQRKKI